MPTPRDYEESPERYRLGMRVSAAFTDSDLAALIVEVLARRGCRLVLDVGCGDGPLAAAASPPLRVIGVDAAAPMVLAARALGPAVRADLTALPVADGSVDAVVAVNVLDHLDDPARGLREAHRVLAPGGWFVAGTISRHDSPELAPVWAPTPTPFDAEDAPALVESVFGSVEVDPWDAPLVTLPDRKALRDYLVARFVAPESARRRADDLAVAADLPLTITKRGALVMARRR